MNEGVDYYRVERTGSGLYCALAFGGITRWIG